MATKKSRTTAPEKLAIHGGTPVVQDPDMTVYRWPEYGPEAVAAVTELLNGGWLKSYTDQKLLEQELCAYFGCKYAISMINGTAALHSACHAVGLGPGDEMITPSYTYWATSLVCRMCGAVPVFADVCRDSANLDAKDVERRITPRTKAIMLVHLWGMPCDMDAIMGVARRHKLKVIEDASHAHGSTYRGRKIGTFGDAGCFSMQGSKLMPAMEGGFMLTNNPDVYARALALGHYGRVPADHECASLNPTGLGYKYRIHPVGACLARIQLRKLDQQNAFIVGRVQRVTAALARLKGIETFRVPRHIKRVNYQFEVLFHDEQTGVSKEKLVEALRAEGALVVHERYPLQHWQPVYRQAEYWNRLPDLPKALPVSQELHDKVIGIPNFANADEKIVDQYIEAFQKVWRHLDDLR